MTTATWRCGHTKTPENTHGGTERSHAQCRTCRRATQRAADKRYASAPGVKARKRKAKRELYATRGAAYRAAVRSNARRPIKTYGLDLDDFPRFKLLKDRQKATT